MVESPNWKLRKVPTKLNAVFWRFNERVVLGAASTVVGVGVLEDLGICVWRS